MDKTLSEVFGAFTYSQRLSYYDLLSHEEMLLENLDALFLNSGADYLDFTPLGDQLRMQCGFEEHNLDLFRQIANDIALILPEGVRGRLLCLEKNLFSYHLFWLEKGIWREQEQIFPKDAPADCVEHKAIKN